MLAGYGVPFAAKAAVGCGILPHPSAPTCQANVATVVLETLSPIYPVPFNVVSPMVLLVHASLAVLTADPSNTL